MYTQPQDFRPDKDPDCSSPNRDNCEHAAILNNIAGECRLMGEHERELELLLEAGEICRKTGFKEIGICAGILSNLALALRKANRLDEAIDCINKTLPLLESLPDRQEEIAIACNNLTELYFATGKRAEAMKYLTRALQEYEKCNDSQKTHYAEVLNSLAGFLYAEKHYKQALTLYRRSARFILRTCGENEEYCITCQNMSRVYERLGNYKMAASAQGTAWRIYARLFGACHERTIAARAELFRLEAAGNIYH